MSDTNPINDSPPETITHVNGQPVDPPFKYNPRLKDTGPGGPVEVLIDLPDGADSRTIFEAVEEAAQVAGLVEPKPTSSQIFQALEGDQA